MGAGPIGTGRRRTRVTGAGWEVDVDGVRQAMKSSTHRTIVLCGGPSLWWINIVSGI